MTQLEFDDKQLDFLLKLSREDLDRAQDEMQPLLADPNAIVADTARKALAMRYDIYMKLLKASGLSRGLPDGANPYRDE